LEDNMNIGLIGAGSIGKQWASAAKKTKAVSLLAVADVDQHSAQAIAQGFEGCVAVSDAKDIFANPDIQGVVIATPHKWLAPMAKSALLAGKHVLCEKPGGISSAEVRANIELAKTKKLTHMIGFNHRYHPAFMEAKKRFDAGEIGELMFVRARYGFGGRPGYEKEWRFSKEIGGGGELIDQGMHMIDMARYFMGEFKDVKGFAENMFWGGEVEDNGFALLRTADKKVAQIHVSWTNWEWVHSFEVFGTAGYLIMHGLDQRYNGPEKLAIGKHNPREAKFPAEETVVFADEQKDDSMRRELDAFAATVCGESVGIPRGEDAEAALKIIEEIYSQNNG
jgi:predicted dehydrogenase